MVTVPQNSFLYRMGAGFAGDVNRTHPANIEPCFNDTVHPVALFGTAVLINAAANGVRNVIAGDTAITTIYGIGVRPYPFQASTPDGAYGAAAQGPAIPPAGEIDVLRLGYMSVYVQGAAGKGANPYVWVAATSGVHIQGGFETNSSGGNTAGPITNVTFNGPADANGVSEVIINI